MLISIGLDNTHYDRQPSRERVPCGACPGQEQAHDASRWKWRMYQPDYEAELTRAPLQRLFRRRMRTSARRRGLKINK